jgi:hypothetical protein
VGGFRGDGTNPTGELLNEHTIKWQPGLIQMNVKPPGWNRKSVDGLPIRPLTGHTDMEGIWLTPRHPRCRYDTSDKKPRECFRGPLHPRTVTVLAAQDFSCVPYSDPH